MLIAEIVPWNTKAVGGTGAVIVPTLMVCTWEQVRLVLVESGGFTGTKRV